MATIVSNCDYYQQTVQLTFSDGTTAVATLDAPTVEKLQAGDDDLMERIRKNLVEAGCVHTAIEENLDVPSTSQSVPSQASDTDGDSKNWKDDETKLLIDIRSQMDDRFQAMKSHVVLWGKVQQKLKEEGVNFTVTQVQTKWRNLKRSYHAVVDHNNKTGVEPKKMKFYDELSALYGTKASTAPPCTMELGTKGADDNADGAGSDSSSSSSVKNKCRKTKKKRVQKVKERKSAAERVLDVLSDQSTKQSELLKSMHDDRMKRMDRFLDLLEAKK